MRKGKKNKGFTLVELIVVIAVLLILSVLAVLAFGNLTEQARLAAIQSDGRALATAIQSSSFFAGDNEIVHVTPTGVYWASELAGTPSAIVSNPPGFEVFGIAAANVNLLTSTTNPLSWDATTAPSGDTDVDTEVSGNDTIFNLNVPAEDTLTGFEFQAFVSVPTDRLDEVVAGLIFNPGASTWSFDLIRSQYIVAEHSSNVTSGLPRPSGFDWTP